MKTRDSSSGGNGSQAAAVDQANDQPVDQEIIENDAAKMGLNRAANGVPIPEHLSLPLDDIAPGVKGLRIAFVNVFAVSHADGDWTLIDGAIPFSASHIRGWAEKQFHRPPAAIVLTHGHFDHVSAAAELAAEWNVPIYAHPLEFPYLTGDLEYPKPNLGAGGGLMTLLSPLYPRKPVDISDRLRPLPLAQSGPVALDELPGWEILHTPGHTPGHVSFYRPADRTLLAGDAFCTTKPEAFFEVSLAQHTELHGPPSYFTSDWEQARRSVELLATLNPAIVAPGHGKPLAGASVAAALRKLADEFDRIAVPENKKLSQQ